MKFEALVYVRLRPNVSDAAGNAVGANVPHLVLTTAAVGKLPVTSDIQNR